MPLARRGLLKGLGIGLAAPAIATLPELPTPVRSETYLTLPDHPYSGDKIVVINNSGRTAYVSINAVQRYIAGEAKSGPTR